MSDDLHQTPNTTGAVRKTLWQIYLWLILLISLVLYYYMLTDELAGWPEYLNIVISGVVFSGAFGYVFARPIGPWPVLWRYACILALASDGVYYAFTKTDIQAGLSTSDFIGLMLVSYLILLPCYIALWRYGDRHHPIWQRKQAK